MLIAATEEWTMRKATKRPGEKVVKDIRRATRKHYSSEEKIRIVLDSLSVFPPICLNYAKTSQTMPLNVYRCPQTLIPPLGKLVSSAVYPQVVIVKLMTLLYISTEGCIG